MRFILKRDYYKDVIETLEENLHSLIFIVSKRLNVDNKIKFARLYESYIQILKNNMACNLSLP